VGYRTEKKDLEETNRTLSGANPLLPTLAMLFPGALQKLIKIPQKKKKKKKKKFLVQKFQKSIKYYVLQNE
jgi:hypothetical protein